MTDYSKMPGPSAAETHKRQRDIKLAARKSLKKTIPELRKLDDALIQLLGDFTEVTSALHLRHERIERDIARLSDTDPDFYGK